MPGPRGEGSAVGAPRSTSGHRRSRCSTSPPCQHRRLLRLCTGTSTTHLQTIAEAIEAALKAEGYRALHREGVAASGWLLLDYGDVVVHVFLPETRAFYALDRLWGDAPELPIEA